MTGPAPTEKDPHRMADPPSILTTTTARRALLALEAGMQGRGAGVRHIYDLEWDERLGSHVAFYNLPHDTTTYIFVLNDELDADGRALWQQVREEKQARDARIKETL